MLTKLLKSIGSLSECASETLLIYLTPKKATTISSNEIEHSLRDTTLNYIHKSRSMVSIIEATLTSKTFTRLYALPIQIAQKNANLAKSG